MLRKKNKHNSTKKVKLVNFREIKQRRDYLHMKNNVFPVVKTYATKTLAVSLWGLMYLLALRFLGIGFTLFNFLSAVGLYFLVEEFKAYFLEFRGSKK